MENRYTGEDWGLDNLFHRHNHTLYKENKHRCPVVVIALLLIVFIGGLTGCGTDSGKVTSIRESVVTNQYTETSVAKMEAATGSDIDSQAKGQADEDRDMTDTSMTTSEDLSSQDALQNVMEETTVSDKVDQLMESMTTEQLIAQMFLVRCPEESAVTFVTENQIGGYILFSRDFENYTPLEVTANISSYQKASRIPMLMGVDEEGGTVVRVSEYPQFRSIPFEAPRVLYNEGGYDAIDQETREKNQLLLSLGINLNFAPVCDLSLESSDFMYERSFGVGVEECSKYVKNTVNISNQMHMGSVLKHFPGYGNNVDTHTGIAVDNRDLNTFEQNDYKPFIAGIEEGAGMVLVSHNIVMALDPDRPASLSKAVHGVLRDQLDFQGVIITDDLSMEAITQYTDGGEAAVEAVLAGNDMLCCTDYEQQYQAVKDAVDEGSITMDQVRASVRRILELKNSLDLLEE